jgi:hypothetical protein
VRRKKRKEARMETGKLFGELGKEVATMTRGQGGVQMENTTCCEKLVAELDAWMKRADYVARELDNTASSDKEKLLPKTMNLHMLVDELEDRIGTLKLNCPEGWEPAEIGVMEVTAHDPSIYGIQDAASRGLFEG